MFLASCGSGETQSGSERVEVRVCPEAIRISERGNPVGVVSGHVRHCWPGEASCFCDSDDDCYAVEGYTPCVPPSDDAATVADVSVAEASVEDVGVADGSVEDVSIADVSIADTSVVDTSVVDASVVDASVVDASVVDVSVVDVSVVDVSVVDASVVDASVVDASVVDASVVDVSVVDVSVVDASVVDVSVVDASVVDASVVDASVADTGSNVCPEAVRISASGNVVGVVSGHIRQCWPGMARCFCDRDDDCYAQSGYVPCTPPVVDAGVDASAVDTSVVDTSVVDASVVDASVIDATVVDASAPTADPVVYGGSFSGATGYYTARLTVMGEGRDVWVYAPASRGANPALVVAFHGTNGDGDVMISGAGLRALADAQGLVVVAPTARWFGEEGADFDHPGGNGTYWDTRSANVNTNADLVLTRAVLVEAQRRYGVDPSRVYAMGHSNGGFMSLLVSVALRDRVAAFAENSAGMVTCANRPACYFQGTSLSCGGLSSETGWCGCTGPGLPVALPTTGRQVPGYLSHNAQDPIVSVFYTCALASRMSALGIPSQVVIRAGGHDLSTGFAQAAWPFLSRYRVP